MRQGRAQNCAVIRQRIFPPRKGQPKIGLSQKTDIPNFGEMYPVLDRSIRRRGAQRAIRQKCPKPPSGGEAAQNTHTVQAVNRHKLPRPALTMSRGGLLLPAHFYHDEISSNTLLGRFLRYLSIFRRENLMQATASHDTGRHSMAPDAKRFHVVPNGRRDSRSSMLHPAAPLSTFAPLEI